MDENDEVIGEEPKLLLNAVSISAEGLQALADSYGGVALPAHIDRDSYSLYHSLGCIPEEYGFSYVELSLKCDEEFVNSNKDLKGRFQILRNSDAHNLANIAEPEHFLLLDKNKPNSHFVVNMLKNKPVNR
jgi:PHP family Zn ribbon phosphoesterase